MALSGTAWQVYDLGDPMAGLGDGNKREVNLRDYARGLLIPVFEVVNTLYTCGLVSLCLR